jgi:hypothetical protein
VRINIDEMTEELFETCTVEHRAGADDACGRQAGNLRDSLGENVDRIAHDDDRAANAGESLADVADQDYILAEQSPKSISRRSRRSNAESSPAFRWIVS